MVSFKHEWFQNNLSKFEFGYRIDCVQKYTTQGSLNKSNAQISVGAFFVVKKAQQFEFDGSNLILDQSGARFSNSSEKDCMH